MGSAQMHDVTDSASSQPTVPCPASASHHYLVTLKESNPYQADHGQHQLHCLTQPISHRIRPTAVMENSASSSVTGRVLYFSCSLGLFRTCKRARAPATPRIPIIMGKRPLKALIAGAVDFIQMKSAGVRKMGWEVSNLRGHRPSSSNVGRFCRRPGKVGAAALMPYVARGSCAATTERPSVHPEPCPVRPESVES